MRKPAKIVNLAAALGSLVTPEVGPEIANAMGAKSPRSELMGFTVYRNNNGTLPSKHASHYSHSSHYSSVY